MSALSRAEYCSSLFTFSFFAFVAALLLVGAVAANANASSAFYQETVSLEVGKTREFQQVSFTLIDASGSAVMLDAADSQGKRLLQNAILAVNDSAQAGAVQVVLLGVRDELRNGKFVRSALLSFSLIEAEPSARPAPRETEAQILEVIAPTNATTVCVEQLPLAVEVTRETRVYADAAAPAAEGAAADAAAGAAGGAAGVTLVSLKVKNLGSVEANGIELTEKLPGGAAAGDAVFDEAPEATQTTQTTRGTGTEVKWLIKTLESGGVREFKYALKKPFYASAFAQPDVTGTRYDSAASASAGGARKPSFFEENFWPSAAWIIFLSIFAFVAAQIYFARLEQKEKLWQGPKGYRKRRTSYRLK